MHRLGMKLATAAAGVLLAFDANAAPGSEVPLHVQFAPDSACLDDDALARELRARGLRPAEPGETSRADVKVQARPTGPGYEATMVLMTPGDAPAVRVLAAASCEEVWSSFALTLALALAQLPDAPVEVKPPAPEPPPPPAPVPAPEKKLLFDVGALTRVNFGVTPNAAISIGLAGDVEFRRDKGMHAYRARFGIFTVPASMSSKGKYALQAVELGFCPLRFASPEVVHSPVVLRPCGTLEVGRLQGAAEGQASGELGSSLWMVLKAGASARWMPTRPLFIEVEAALGLPIARPAFSYGGNVIFETPWIIGHAGIFAGLLFP
ncbi:hypothetical protein LVJ94_50220 [Pendulispora rubella]|uniref:Uncharacterized protein n=1 Tax=Pendulispora rubella TaxID=2741070 RepID=A0ABZ2L2I6_9BACT